MHPMPFARARREDFRLQIRALSTAGARFFAVSIFCVGRPLAGFLGRGFYCVLSSEHFSLKALSPKPTLNLNLKAEAERPLTVNRSA